MPEEVWNARLQWVNDAMPTKGQLGPDDNGKEFGQKVYCSMIGSFASIVNSMGALKIVGISVV